MRPYSHPAQPRYSSLRLLPIIIDKFRDFTGNRALIQRCIELSRDTNNASLQIPGRSSDCSSNKATPFGASSRTAASPPTTSAFASRLVLPPSRGGVIEGQGQASRNAANTIAGSTHLDHDGFVGRRKEALDRTLQRQKQDEKRIGRFRRVTTGFHDGIVQCVARVNQRIEPFN